MVDMKKLTRRMFSTRTALIVYYLYAAAIVMFLAAFDPLDRDPWIVLLSQASIAFLTIAFAVSGIGRPKLLTLPSVIGFLAASAILNVFSHAFIYQDVGLVTSAGLESDLAFSDAVYFSIVTFTTLGYGDYQPHPDLRILSALQALYGYIYLGLLIGLIANASSATQNSNN